MPSTAVFELIYVSHANDMLKSRAARQDLRIHAQIQNKRRDISGVLLYSNGVILQVLQGAEETVRTCFAVIEIDSRHRDVQILRAGLIAKRTFAEWSMALVDLDESAQISETKMNAVLAEARQKDHPVPEGAEFIQQFMGLAWREQVIA
jgi:Sensors of blue-light using FAD